MSNTNAAGCVAFGCVAEATPTFYAQVRRMIQSIRWFGGSLADADIFVCVVGEIDPAARREFIELGAQVRQVAEFNPINPHCNKIRFFELPELMQYETAVLLDCDVALVQDPAPYFDQPSLQLKIADLPSVPNELLASLCAHFGLPVPEPVYQTTCSQEPTIWYCNTGVMIVPTAWLTQIVPAWRNYIVQLSQKPGLFGPPFLHTNQAAMALVYLSGDMPFRELPVAMNFPLNQTDRLPAPALLHEDPVILHYHDGVDSEGLLLPVPYPLAQKRIEQLNRRLREAGAARAPQPSPAVPTPHGVNMPPMPFVIGSGRSGTTLLRLMLDSHPALAIPPETHFIPDLVRACQRAAHPAERFVETLTQHERWPDFQIDAAVLREAIMALEPFTLGDGLRVFYQAYAARFGKQRYGDKTPPYSLCAEQIQALLPEAHFIHLIRDGRDTAMSFHTIWGANSSIEETARLWAGRIRAARRQAPELKHYLEVRYEDLVLEPEPTLRRICEFLGLEWHPAMLDYHKRAAGRLEELKRPIRANDGAVYIGEQRLAIHRMTSKPPQSQRVTAWRQDMSPEDLALVEAEVGDVLGELGYPLSSMQTAQAPARVAVCVTGMHRSGTSLIGQLLHNCGPYLGSYRLLANPAPDNLDGYWEHPEVRQINDDILAHFGGGWDMAPAMPEGWEKLAELEPLRQRARLLIQQFDTQTFWGWKDPRTALTMPFWRQLVPGLKVVVCVRNPLEVAHSLSQRGMSSLAFGLRLWQTYYERLLAAVPPANRIITHYDAYFVDAAAETRRVLAWLGIPTSADLLERACAGAAGSMRHHRSTLADLLAAGAPTATLRLYGELCDEEVGAPPGAALAGISSPNSSASDYAAPAADASLQTALALLHAHEAELNELRPLAGSIQTELAILRPVLAAREKEVAFLMPALAAREGEIANLMRELAATRDVLAAREAEIEATRVLLLAREAEIGGHDRELASLRDVLAARETEIEASRVLLIAREAEIGGHDRELASLRDVLAAREAEIEASRVLLLAREAEIGGYTSEFTATREVLAAREGELANFACELAATRKLLAAREGEIANYARELTAAREVIAAREELFAEPTSVAL